MPSKTTDLEKAAADALAGANAVLDKGINRSRRKAKTTKVEKQPAAKASPASPPPAAAVGELVNAPTAQGANYAVRSGVPSLSEQDYTARFEAVQGQLRATKIAQENARLDTEQLRIEELNLGTQLQETRNLIAGERIVTETVKLGQQQARTQLERAKLTGIQIDVAGEQAQLEPKQQLQDIRLQGARIDVEGSRALLAPQQTKWALQLEAAELKLEEMRGNLQRQRASLGAAPFQIEQLS